jgi:hypothetical protein
MVSGRSKVASGATLPSTKISHAMATMKVSSSMNPLVTRLGRAPTVHLCQEPWTQAQELAVASVVEQPDEVVKAVGAAPTDLQEVGYPQRLLQLAKCAEEVVPGVVGRRTAEGHPSQWKALVCRARNEFAHRLYGGWLDADRIDQYLTVTGSLQWLLTAVLLLETGVPAGSLAEQFGQHQPYLSFLREAQAWVPRVYTPAEETSA